MTDNRAAVSKASGQVEFVFRYRGNLNYDHSNIYINGRKKRYANKVHWADRMPTTSAKTSPRMLILNNKLARD